jgi:DNA (cytosine-5)-methyltransferase 1
VSLLTIPDLMGDVKYGGEITWSDFFCGAGGSSNGLDHVPGFRVKYALNHWDLAVMAHEANFPDTDHEVSTIEEVHPSRFERTDCAWFSPSCTAQSYCGPRGIDDESVRSRATMTDVVRWTEWHRYDAVVIENVIEAKLWCDIPSHRQFSGPPNNVKAKGCSCGATYDEWYTSMEALGYRGQEVYFNSQHALVPQSRDRLYVVFTRQGVPLPDLDFTPPAYCLSCESAVAGIQTWKVPNKKSRRDNPRLHRWGRYGTQYLYTCPSCRDVVAPAVVGSWSIVDHSLPINTIGSRPRPIASATRKRIKIGLERLARLQPIQLQIGGNLFERPGYARVWSLEDPLRTITTTPYMAMRLPAGAGNAHARESGESAHTITGSDRLGIVVQNMNNNVGITTVDNYMLVTLRRGMDGRAKSEPQPTQSTRSDQGIIVYNGVISEADIDDMYFRMLQWPELQRGQAMHVRADGQPYQLTARVRTKRGTYKELSNEQRVRLIGNAVSSPVATIIGHSIARALAVAT